MYTFYVHRKHPDSRTRCVACSGLVELPQLSEMPAAVWRRVLPAQGFQALMAQAFGLILGRWLLKGSSTISRLCSSRVRRQPAFAISGTGGCGGGGGGR